MSAITIEEARTHLNITNTSQDAELGTFVAAAEAAIVARIGPLVSTPVTRRLAGGRPMLLPVYPVVSLTSVTAVDGAAVSLDDIYVDPVGSLTTTYGFSAAQYDVVYNAGHAADAATLPADLRLAVLEMTRHLWESQRRSRGSEPPAGAAHAFPYRVEELLAPYMMFGIA